MIEWVPINDFEFIRFKPYLVIYKEESETKVALYLNAPVIDRYFYAQNKITHAAYINFPVEKTLEEKFKEQYPWTIDACTKLAQIAKEHYEAGKECPHTM